MSSGIIIRDSSGKITLNTAIRTARYIGEVSFTIKSYNHKIDLPSTPYDADNVFAVVYVDGSSSNLHGYVESVTATIIKIAFRKGISTTNPTDIPPANGLCYVNIFEWG